MNRSVMLVVAKAPVIGRVKTRLGREVGMERAADLAAAALLDTVRACAAAYGAERCHLSLDGDLADGQLAEEILEATTGWTVHTQHGKDFAERLVHAHEDASVASGAPVVQVGMDTPHLSARTLLEVGTLLTAPDAAVLGPAYDGGWWLLGVGGPHLLAHLHEVPMSRPETGALTREALLRAGARVSEVATLRDVDEVVDAESVAAEAPDTRFARSWR
jgi:glycosyltransferase A (GT-A) superfamily protein (DUF2064 family)